jgi:pyruvate,orthophosphate dikinase
MQGLPITIRLLDPPLHEFLPHGEAELLELASQMDMTPDEVKSKVESLKEVNPMLGHRGCRLGISYPEIYEMQARAIFEAACELAEEGVAVSPEVMIPLVGHVNEFKFTKKLVDRMARTVMDEAKREINYMVGTMIELPRTALTADEVALEAEFFSFGTNDLTQTVFGVSRDDAGKFLSKYVSEGFLEDDPFVTIDADGVGALMRMGTEKGRAARSDLKIGICGEHGGDPKSVELCYKLGLDYVSCSPYRVPVARLAAAQATLNDTD